MAPVTPGSTQVTFQLGEPWSWADEQLVRAVGASLDRWLPAQRWFAAKTKSIAQVAVLDACQLADCAAWLLLDVQLTDGARQCYQTFLTVAAEPRAGAIARIVEPGGREQWLLDDPTDPAVAAGLWRLMAEATERPARAGQLRGHRTPALVPAEPDAPHPPAIPLSAEQSNSSVVYGQRFVLKLYRRVELGLNPDWELSRCLTQEAHFAAVPAVAGGLEYVASGQTRWLGLLQAWTPNQGDAWSAALRQLAVLLSEAQATIAQPPIERLELADAEVARHAPRLALLGERTAQMHLALARAAGSELAPVRADEAFRRRWRRRAVAALDAALAGLVEQRSALVAADRALADRLLAQADRLSTAFAHFAEQPLAAWCIRVHGDFHLGQVLVTGDDFAILDFEGEPARPLAERREPQLAVKDVAGMVRSFDYAAHVAVRAWRAAHGEAADDALAYEVARGAALAWRDAATRVFLAAYQATAAGAPFQPADAAEFQRLLRLHVLEKAVYELLYELNHRPDWVGIPLAAIAGED